MSENQLSELGFNIEPIEQLGLNNSTTNYTKLSLSDNDKAHISLMVQQFPSMGIVGSSKNL